MSDGLVRKTLAAIGVAAMLAALPASALTIHVGRGASRAGLRLPDPAAVRRFLRGLLMG